MNIEKKTYLRPEIDIFSMSVRAGLCEMSPQIDDGVTHEGFEKQVESIIWAD